MILKKTNDLKKINNHLIKYYDDLNWGEDLQSFLKENLELCKTYDGVLIELEEDQNIIGGLILYYNHNFKSYVIGCAAIDSSYRRKGYYSGILNDFNFVFQRLYFFCQPHLVDFYSKFFKYLKQVVDKNIYIVSNYEITKEEDGPFF